MKPIKILVVDNEEDQRRLISIILNKFGYFVKTVSSAEAALTEMDSENFDLIITDLIMPEMDGPESSVKDLKPRFMRSRVMRIYTMTTNWSNSASMESFKSLSA